MTAGQANVEAVRRAYDAWERDDVGAFLSAMHPDVEYVNPEGAVEPGTLRGVEAFRSALEKVREAWDHWRMEPEELIEAGDSVVAVLSYRARGAGSGIDVEGREGAVWTFAGGKVVRYAWFQTPDEALAAAGLKTSGRAPGAGASTV